jgi:predicted small lipoprotein YifL
MRAVFARIVVCAAVLAGGCGVKGPLYLPNTPKDAPWPQRKPAPAPTSSPASSAPAPATPSQTPESKP